MNWVWTAFFIGLLIGFVIGHFWRGGVISFAPMP